MESAEIKKKIAHVHARCWADDAYKARFKADPHGVLAEAGIHVPADTKIQVHEEGAQEGHWVIPARPDHVTDEHVSGAAASPDICTLPNICTFAPNICTFSPNICTF
jgi:hypothetical protein